METVAISLDKHSTGFKTMQQRLRFPLYDLGPYFFEQLPAISLFIYLLSYFNVYILLYLNIAETLPPTAPRVPRLHHCRNGVTEIAAINGLDVAVTLVDVAYMCQFVTTSTGALVFQALLFGKMTIIFIQIIFCKVIVYFFFKLLLFQYADGDIVYNYVGLRQYFFPFL